MNALFNWIESRTGLGAWFGQATTARVPGRACLCRALPCMLLFALVMQGITGLFMLMRYCPGTRSAWESVYYLQFETQAGWLLRAMHHYTGQAVLVLVGIYLVGMILRGAYRAPREFVYWAVLFLGLVTLALLLTGDLLAWDENSRSATLTRVGFLEAVPGVGESLFKLAAAGPEFGNLTLSQFTVLHTIVFSGAFFLLLVLRWWFVRRPATAENETTPAVSGAFYWPCQTLVNMVGCLILLGIVLGFSLSHGTSGDLRGVELGVPANPTGFYDAARPEWAFMGLYGFSKLDIFAGSTIVPIFIIPTAVVTFFLLMPFIGRIRFGRFPAGHLLNVVVVLGLLLGNTLLTFKVIAQDKADPDHQLAISQSRLEAERLPELIRRNGGIPPAGPLALLEADPKTQGPKLFRQHCATCHDYIGGTPADIKAEESTAPNLFGFGSRKWVAGLLDYEQIKGDQYFGNTELKKGEMVGFVRDTFSEGAMKSEGYDAEERADIMNERKQIVMALSAQAKLISQREMDAKDAKQIASGLKLIGDKEDGLCIDCHRFGDAGSPGLAPDLTNYASRDWTIGIIRNPAAPKYYGDKNDRMQAYAESENSAMNLLSDPQIEALVDWMRGEGVE